MTKLIETAAMVLGGLSLFAVSFVAFTVVSGGPLEDVAVIGKFFASSEEDSDSDEPAPTTETPQEKPKTNTEVVEASLGSIGVWSLPSPFTQTELRTLTDELKGKLQQLDLREADLERREKDLASDQEIVTERFTSLETMRKDLEAFKAELMLREQEVIRDEGAAEERENARWADVARVIAGLEDEVAGRRLISFPAEEAATILLAMEPERAAELLNQLEGDDWKSYVEAYTDARAKVR